MRCSQSGRSPSTANSGPMGEAFASLAGPRARFVSVQQVGAAFAITWNVSVSTAA